ncbi:IclR family transcriptional regulator [Streptomyces oceani]|uniref:Glycerol operon regulatory protein n=1 Tax=Streptomyces oceani TaxID=1075402 RepID=A0A1E7KN09_9ACTN|nr:IclR family transcriptional regulator [Streptomyces oceani]OEV05362.1 IclR family transcriptional regulator [Streptomyces oceani]
MSDDRRKAVRGGGGSGGGSTAVQSVDRAVTILGLLARHEELGATDLAEELGVHKSTAFRLALALEQRGLVEQAADRGKYRLAHGIVRLGGAASAQLDITRESRRVCRDLAEELGEGVNLAVIDGTEAIHVSQVRGLGSISAYNWVGQQTPLHATSSGKVLLAYEPVATVDAVLARGLERFTGHTLAGAAELRAELAEVRERGWGSTAEEYEVGLNAIACPVHGVGDAVVAALSISGPSYRLPPRLFPAVARSIAAGAEEIGRRMKRLG